MGLGAIFCTQQLPLHTAADGGMIKGIPARLRSYIRAFCRLYPHRAELATSFGAVMGEPLFFNAAITDPAGRPLGGAHWHQGAEAGVHHAGDLRRLHRPLAGHSACQQEPISVAEAQSVLRALPMHWQGLSYSRRSLYRTGQRGPSTLGPFFGGWTPWPRGWG
jgi:hypothetical protein